MTAYWVVGGEYASTDFNKIAPGKTEQRFGPYAGYEDALAKWSELAWQTVDNCNVRYRILCSDGADGAKATRAA